jgi:methylenetetrahydrofolate reductase (NADPH)
LKTNSKGDSPNAVTWGIFPGREIVQPTVVESGAFLAWKDEAFELWNQWCNLYPKNSSASSLLTKLKSSLFLVNLVDNNFRSRYTLFDLLDEVHRDLTSSIGH